MSNFPKILHLGSDNKFDGQFMVSAKYIFETAFPKNNTFYLFKIGNDKFNFIDFNYFSVDTDSESLSNFIEIFDSFDIIILHNLDQIKAELVINYSKTNKFIWLLWGSEFYENPLLFRGNLLGKISRRVNRSILNIIKGKVSYYFMKYFPFSNKSNQITKRAANLIQALGIIHEEDYYNMKTNKVLSENSKYLKFTYYPIEFILNIDCQSIENRNNIIVGNSATITNNHLEVIELIKNHNLEGANIYFPLSYGDKSYADLIISRGKEVFQGKFIPLTEFVSLNDFNNILAGCRIAIMNHYRQQAVGNIITLLYLGAKLFLNDKNTLYHYLKRIGCTIYSVSEIEKMDSINLMKPLSEKEILKNREILYLELNTKNLAKSLYEFVNINFQRSLNLENYNN